eukprot:8931795-Pyramimonas_sp.AAC.1
MYITTHNRKGTCSATSALAEASYSSLTSLCYYTLKSTHSFKLETLSKTPCMTTCDTILCRLHPHVGLQQNTTNLSHQHPTTT